MRDELVVVCDVGPWLRRNAYKWRVAQIGDGEYALPWPSLHYCLNGVYLVCRQIGGMVCGVLHDLFKWCVRSDQVDQRLDVAVIRSA